MLFALFKCKCCTITAKGHVKTGYVAVFSSNDKDGPCYDCIL